jgi:predicted nuclease of restriction endonuclease-like (RecB) superfamily
MTENMETNNTNIATQEFAKVHGIISQHRSRALQAVNKENLLTAWEVGAFVSARLKNSAWGNKTVTQLSEYLRAQDPTLRGYSRRNIYNMVSLYDTYSSAEFQKLVEKLKLNEIVQLQTAQLKNADIDQIQSGQIVQALPAQIENTDIVQIQSEQLEQEIVNIETGQIVQSLIAQFPNFLNLISLSNHFEIINTCKTIEECIFYTLYAYKENLNYREMLRCLKNKTFNSLMGDKHNISKGLKEIYPQAAPMLKDTLFLDFLGLPQKHSEKRLQNSILTNMKDFILELGKDFLHYATELSLQVGNSIFKIDLVFFHRGLQFLVAIELKTGKFKPEYMGQLEFYLEALDRDVRRSNENPSIGILLCQETDRSVVEYAMSRSLSPTMIAEYKRQLIPKEVLQQSLNEFCNFLTDKK